MSTSSRLASLADRARLERVADRLARRPLGRVADGAFTARVLAEAGVARPLRPDKLVRIGLGLHRWGASPAAGIAAAAIRRGEEVGLADDAGDLSFEELHRRSNALAHSLRADGIGPGDGVAVMCRNHRGFVDTTLACSKLGADALFMNTAFAAPQLADVVERERPVALVYDAEFEGLLEGARREGGAELRRYVAWGEQGSGDGGDPGLEELIRAGRADDLDPPEQSGRFVILTSGTTGAPKGAQRHSPETLAPLAALLERIPLRARERTMIAAPMFHSWGFVHFTLGLALSSSYVVRQRFDPEETLRATAESGATALVLVPVMMQRILELPEEVRSRHDLSALRVTAVSGSALPGSLANDWMDAFGEGLYNLYGSTEVAWATIATPEDLRAAPGTAGRPPRNTVVRIVDADGNDVAAGASGRIFVGNEMAFEGYTGGGGKEALASLLSSGDIGHFDPAGRLFIDGRDDEMIVSGGENVFPREVEDLLAGLDGIEEVAVVGVEDEEFGQRLKAFVVARGDDAPSADRIKDHVKGNLARYKVPREVEFLDSLPRNATGKVLKRELA